MNNDTIKAAEEYANKEDLKLNNYHAYLAGAEYMQAQKDEQIKELVEALEKAHSVIKSAGGFWGKKPVMDTLDELIQKYKG